MPSDRTLRAGSPPPVRVEVFEPPEDAGRCPAVVLLHGAEGLEAGSDYRGAARDLARAGYLVHLPHYLDRTGEPRATFSQIGPKFSIWRAAVGEVVDALAAAGHRVGLVGVSLGAALALAQAAQDRRIAALVDVSGFLPAGLAERSDLHLPPTLLVHGQRDAIVPVSNAHAMARLLDRLGTVHELVLQPDEAHAFGPAARTETAARARDFLLRYLPGGPET